MTKLLEELFNLPNVNEGSESIVLQEDDDDENIDEMLTPDILATVEKVEAALPQVRGLDASDKEMDEIANMAKEGFNNLMDLGMQSDGRSSAEIFAVASTMLGHAITAKTAKINKKLKMIDLQLKKAELDRKLAAAAEKDASPDKTPLGLGAVLDRNELIKEIMSSANSKSS